MSKKIQLQHTPGPWSYQPSQLDGEFIICGSNEHGANVLPILGRTHNWPNNCEANARLIAASPDMKLLLESAIDGHEYSCDFWQQWNENAKILLAKIEGDEDAKNQTGGK